MRDGNGNLLGQMLIDYKPSGYEATMNGEKITMVVDDSKTIVTMGNLVITMPVSGNYYHKSINTWRKVPVTTSFGDVGVASMLYAGFISGGHLYYEEIFLNARIFKRTETMVDNFGRIIWSTAYDRSGVTHLTRR